MQILKDVTFFLNASLHKYYLHLRATLDDRLRTSNSQPMVSQIQNYIFKHFYVYLVDFKIPSGVLN